MDAILAAVKSDLPNVINLGRQLILGLFILAAFVTYLGIAKGKSPGWAGLITSLVIGLTFLTYYEGVMDWCRSVMINVNNVIAGTNNNYVLQYGTIVQNMHQEFKYDFLKAPGTNLINYLEHIFSPTNVITSISFSAYAIISKMMTALRYCMVGMVYMIGPVLIPFILFKETKVILRGWFITYMSILAWPIFWNISLGVLVALSHQIGTSGSNLEEYVAMNFAVCFILAMTPIIVTGIVNGVGAGAEAAVGALMGAAMMGSDTVQKGMGSVKGGLDTAKGMARSFAEGGLKKTGLNAYKGWAKANPTMRVGKFRNQVLKPIGKGVSNFSKYDFSGLMSK